MFESGFVNPAGCTNTGGSTYLSPVKTFDLSTLGFTPPFSLKVPGAP